MQSNPEDTEEKVKLILHYKNNLNDIKSFTSSINEYKSQLNTLNEKIDTLKADLKSYDIIDYIYHKIPNNKITDLKFVNMLIQQVKECKDDISDNEEYLSKCTKIYNYLVGEGTEFIISILHKSIDTLYLNNEFVIFTNLLEKDLQIKQIILWHRQTEYNKKIEWYKGDINIFYRMLIKQECLIWSRLFYTDFKDVLSNLRKEGFLLYEKFILSLLIKYFESTDMNMDEVLVKDYNDYKLDVESFHKNIEVQDVVYELLVKKCYKAYFKTSEEENILEL